MMTTERITIEEYESRLRALLGAGGLRVGFPKKRRDLWILLQAIAERFRDDERLDEVEVNRRIASFLAERAPDWEMDRATLRRALVDEGFMERDAGGTVYRSSTRYGRMIAFET